MMKLYEMNASLNQGANNDGIDNIPDAKRKRNSYLLILVHL